MDPLTKFIVGLGCSITGGLLRAWALVTLWGWFVVPTFHLQPLGYAAAWGVALCAAYAIRPLPRTVKGQEEDMTTHFAMCLLAPPMVVCAGWIGHLFM